MLNFRSPPELTARIDAWIGAQPDPTLGGSAQMKYLFSLFPLAALSACAGCASRLHMYITLGLRIQRHSRATLKYNAQNME